MEGYPALPCCCQCYRSVAYTALLAMPCLHTYCRGCITVETHCTVCGIENTENTVLFPLKQSFEAYKRTKTEEKYAEMMENLNCDGVLCVNGVNCRGKGVCRYEHNRDFDDKTWVCRKDGWIVDKNTVCPRCGGANPEFSVRLNDGQTENDHFYREKQRNGRKTGRCNAIFARFWSLFARFFGKNSANPENRPVCTQKTKEN